MERDDRSASQEWNMTARERCPYMVSTAGQHGNILYSGDFSISNGIGGTASRFVPCPRDIRRDALWDTGTFALSINSPRKAPAWLGPRGIL